MTQFLPSLLLLVQEGIYVLNVHPRRSVREQRYDIPRETIAVSTAVRSSAVHLFSISELGLLTREWAVPVGDPRHLRITTDHRTMDRRTMDHRIMDRRTMDRRIMDHRTTDHRTMDHRIMDRRTMDHRTMDRRITDRLTMDHRTTNHRTMDHRTMDHRITDHRTMDHHTMVHPITDRRTMDPIIETVLATRLIIHHLFFFFNERTVNIYLNMDHRITDRLTMDQYTMDHLTMDPTIETVFATRLVSTCVMENARYVANVRVCEPIMLTLLLLCAALLTTSYAPFVIFTCRALAFGNSARTGDSPTTLGRLFETTDYLFFV